MGIPGKVEGIYSGRRLVGKGGKPEECPRSNRRIQKGIWEGRKKGKGRTQRNAGEVHSKNAIWVGRREVRSGIFEETGKKLEALERSKILPEEEP